MGDFRAALAELVATASVLVVIDFRFQCESNDSEVQRALRPPFTAERVHLFLSAAALEFYTTASRKFVREGDGFACDQLSVEAVVQNVDEDDDQAEEHKAESGRIVRGKLEGASTTVDEVKFAECRCEEVHAAQWQDGFLAE
ncbi:hypothetical protein M3Y99_01475800 [Aphelenchoides fujianensis]|nr:hypothetical protein M3Y99_01475800 [Aphelenchoides fujianensis]